jgi:hypothetical protein
MGIYPGYPYAGGKQETVGLLGGFGAAQFFEGTAFGAFSVGQGFYILEKGRSEGPPSGDRQKQ